MPPPAKRWIIETREHTRKQAKSQKKRTIEESDGVARTTTEPTSAKRQRKQGATTPTKETALSNPQRLLKRPPLLAGTTTAARNEKGRFESSTFSRRGKNMLKSQNERTIIEEASEVVKTATEPDTAMRQQKQGATPARESASSNPQQLKRSPLFGGTVAARAPINKNDNGDESRSPNEELATPPQAEASDSEADEPETVGEEHALEAEPEPEEESYLPEVMQNLGVPAEGICPATAFAASERLPVNHVIISAYDLDRSVKKLESFLSQAEDCELAHSAISDVIWRDTNVNEMPLSKMCSACKGRQRVP
jgi:hypothetical protein